MMVALPFGPVINIDGLICSHYKIKDQFRLFLMILMIVKTFKFKCHSVLKMSRRESRNLKCEGECTCYIRKHVFTRRLDNTTH